MKKISVIMTCFDGYIERTLKSLYQQTYQQIDLLVIDTMNNPNFLNQFQYLIDQSPFSKTEVIALGKQSINTVRNLGLSWAENELIMFVDNKTELPKNYIELAVEDLLTNDLSFVYSDTYITESNHIMYQTPESSIDSLVQQPLLDLSATLFSLKYFRSQKFTESIEPLYLQDFAFLVENIQNKTFKKLTQVKNYSRQLKTEIQKDVEKIVKQNYLLSHFDVKGFMITQAQNLSDNLLDLYNVAANQLLQMDELLQKQVNRINGLSNRIASLTKEVEDQETLVENKEQVIDNKEEVIRHKDDVINHILEEKNELLTSTTWKIGNAILKPMRKIKGITSHSASFTDKQTEVAFIEEKKPEIKKRQSFEEVILDQYHNWIHQVELPVRSVEKNQQQSFTYQPKISILIPVYKVEAKWLRRCLRSIEKQWYANWEVCIVDDASNSPEITEVLEEYRHITRVKVAVHQKNRHISQTTNTALEMATGEFIALVDHDDELTEDALYEVVKVLNQHPNAQLIYTDEDKLTDYGFRYDPHFKPDWSPDLLMNQNYISHLGIYRTDIAKQIDGFRIGYEGVQDYDFLLRYIEQIDTKQIYHIPKILYHWRAIVGSTALDVTEKSTVYELGAKVLNESLQRRNIKGNVQIGRTLGDYKVNYEIIGQPLVSIIIPTRNGYDDVKLCIDSIIKKSTYLNYEIILADNGSDDPNMQVLFDAYKAQLKNKFTHLYLDIPFNYSRINNLAVAAANGEYVLFLNNDTEVITSNWLEKMLGFAQMERTGCVGAKLWYYDNTIQHGGVIVGNGGIAGHSFIHVPKGEHGYFRRLDTDYNYTAVTAACMMMRKSVFEQVGGFDETLAVAFNDVDLCIRVYLAGYHNVWAHEAELYHYESKSRGYEDTPEKQARFVQEIDTMKLRYGTFLLNDPAYNVNFSLYEEPFTGLGR